MPRSFSRRLIVSTLATDYERTVHSRPVTFTCQECGRQETREQLPGPTPKYCGYCWPTVQARRNADRQRRHRERQRAGGDTANA